MIEIVKSGQKKFIAVCSKCGCIFSYELEDLDIVFKRTVNCPECGDKYYHLNQDSILDKTLTFINDVK